MDNCLYNNQVEDEFEYIIKYGYDIEGVYEKYMPSCFSLVNNTFAVFTKKIDTGSEEKIISDALAFGYSAVPKLYVIMKEDEPNRPDINADAVKRVLDLDGRGVIIGIVDTGIDYTNPDFITTEGNTRIIGMWDQKNNREYTKEEISDALASDNPYNQIDFRDENGHGTYIASVIAGNNGIANASEIAVVKLRPARDSLRQFWGSDVDVCYSEADIMFGIKYLLITAAEQKKPIVICIALGTNSGDHDGNTFLERYIESWANVNGVCMVSCTGNEVGENRHCRNSNEITDDGDSWYQYEDMEISIPEERVNFATEIWSRPPGEIDVYITSPSGERYTNIAAVKNQLNQHMFLFERTTVYGYNQFADDLSGNQMIFLRWRNASAGIWRLTVREKSNIVRGGFDSWLSIGENSDTHPRFLNSSSDVTITSPGNTNGCITAGCYNSETESIYVRSGKGFTASGEYKPDICAPGVNISGALARNRKNQPITYTNRSGGSVAAAVTTGAAALIMQWGVVEQRRYSISTKDIKLMLTRGAARKPFISYPSRDYGFGLIDLLNTFDVMR